MNSINLDSQIQIRYMDTKHPLAHVMSGTIFCVCSALRFQLGKLRQKRWRSGCKNKKKKTGLWQNQSPRAMNLSSHVSRQVPHPRKVRLHPKVRGYPQPREPVATKEESRDVDFSESEQGGPVACKTATGEPHASKKSDCREPAREDQELKGQNGHTIYTCLQPQSTIRKQYSRSLGEIYGREQNDPVR